MTRDLNEDTGDHWLTPRKDSALARYVDAIRDDDPDPAIERPEDPRDLARILILAAYESEYRKRPEEKPLETARVVAGRLGSDLTANHVLMVVLAQLEKALRLTPEWRRLRELAVDVMIDTMDEVDGMPTKTARRRS